MPNLETLQVDDPSSGGHRNDMDVLQPLDYIVYGNTHADRRADVRRKREDVTRALIITQFSLNLVPWIGTTFGLLKLWSRTSDSQDKPLSDAQTQRSPIAMQFLDRVRAHFLVTANSIDSRTLRDMRNFPHPPWTNRVGNLEK
jgi:hypothetical protein